MLLKCPRCDAILDNGRERYFCPECRDEWPVIDGIPRFFQEPTYYWGEVSRHEARELLDAARRGSWVEAVRARFPERDNVRFGLLDLQRASWAPMLGLDERSVALDIGSGYGAITHSLSRSVGELYSVEPVSERIEFTQERLRQEGIHNVQLIQASATALPLVENSFDLVVVNGVLEWVGEWDLEGSPRSAQLRFLDTICRLLKDDGALLIGIENRFGYGLFCGGTDHSGIPYTSLVPRRLASFMRRHSSSPRHCAQLNLKKEYRTYTYTERGYRKLLVDAGFAGVACYWAEPGYNQPYCLIPLAMPQWIREHFRDQLDHPGPSPRQSWRRRLKRVVSSSRFLSMVLPEFVLLASKRRWRTAKVQSWVEEQLRHSVGKRDGGADSQPTTWALYTRAFRPKSIVRLGDPKSSRDLAYLKVIIGDRSSASSLEVELENRARVLDRLQAYANPPVSVPRGFGTLRVGNTSYVMESAAQGTQLSRMVRRLGYFADVRRVQNEFNRFFGSMISLTEVLQKVSGAKRLSSSWREIPEEFDHHLETRAAIEQSRYFWGSSSSSRAMWIQHGDLSVENISLDQETGRIEVFDWSDMASGFPPLYDLFEFFYSTAYLVPAEEAVKFPNDVERLMASFQAIFFTDTGFACVVRDLILQACKRLRVSPELIPALLVEFLLIRSHYYREKSAVQRRVHLRLLQLCFEQNCSVFGTFQLGC
jgi:ubiquinone/menaquinone biosynthesis C-methylase UbiE